MGRQSDGPGERISPPQISAFILQKLKKAAEDYLGEKLKKLSSRFRLISMMLRERH
jgi:molecular chaperone DnaK (HSP70)